ncbi:MAG: hypothetical protein KDA37_08300 [Planctomycetales bacterium]|nr:hypothetical protein [Planctomycetales bacterium]
MIDRFNLGLAALLIIGVCGLTGCGQQPTMAPFVGVVTYKGKLLEFGGVTMQPKGGGPVARGTIQPDGTFSVETDGKPGAMIGTHRVRVTCYTSQRPGATTASTDGEMSLGKPLIPEHYSNFSSSGLEVEVMPEGNQRVSIQLSSP